jgi:hypothetical protein
LYRSGKTKKPGVDQHWYWYGQSTGIEHLLLKGTVWFSLYSKMQHISMVSQHYIPPRQQKNMTPSDTKWYKINGSQWFYIVT